jgi:parallel beta-helix repeat protein
MKNMKSMKLLIIISMLLIASVFPLVTTSIASESRTIYVDDDGGADYTRIQDAVDAADEGDTVYVYPGIYYEQIIIDIPLTLTGEDKTSTIIDGLRLKQNTVFIRADGVHISDFTIQNSSRGLGYESGLQLTNVDSCVIEDMIFTDNCWAAEIRNSNNCVFTENTVSNNENGGIHLVLSTSCTVNDCTFIGNSKTGIHVFSGNDHVISSNTFIDCGLEINIMSTLTITDNIVNGKPIVYLEHETGKLIEDAGQVILNQCKDIVVRNLDLSNTSTGVNVYQSDFIKIIRNTITNTLHGISVESSRRVSIRNNDIRNNRYNGVGVYGGFSNRLSFNQVTENDIGIYLHNSIGTILFLNKVQNNYDHNFLINSMFFPWIIPIG